MIVEQSAEQSTNTQEPKEETPTEQAQQEPQGNSTPNLGQPVEGADPSWGNITWGVENGGSHGQGMGAQ